MLVWSRLGILVPAVWLFFAGVGVAINLRHYVPVPHDAAIVLCLCALTYWPLGIYLEKNLNPSRGPHSFFFIKIKYWSFLALGMACYFSMNNQGQ